MDIICIRVSVKDRVEKLQSAGWQCMKELISFNAVCATDSSDKCQLAPQKKKIPSLAATNTASMNLEQAIRNRRTPKLFGEADEFDSRM